MQKTFKNQQGREILFIEIPLDSDTPYLATIRGQDVIVFNYDDKRIRTENIPQGNYQILCLAKDATEEQSAIVVDLTRVECKHVPSIKYKNYHEKNGMRYNYATCSLTSLLTSLGFKQDDNVLILEKI